ncbi:hypothetical protein AZ54_07630 [Xanthomonas oryzae pv. oryzae PXO86]|uniref:Uncharacterized protein n=1 Tax=Xanthomonas oryzae pv. oryzae (strain PXO99A) TaxID=360094 RepID=A0A0K0GMQ1_XANOP|nr:hypothetical protein PXO_01282 [Xanthomonas oryzae pv. oryzae PXO99A]AJQ85446.1 hypothetical protein AZ54_07630 [Xanthomonas oryzae pv. oryzae PXO86]
MFGAKLRLSGDLVYGHKHVSLTAAFADLGDIATLADQRGPYLSLQEAF